MLRLRENLPSDDAWRREALGIWDDDGTPSIMPTWPACSTRREPPAPACLAVAHDLDRVWLSVAAASRHGVPYVGEVTSAVSGKPLHFRAATGRTEALDEVARICNQRGIPVVVDAKDEPLIEDLKALDRPPRIVPAGFDDYVQGCADLFDAVESKELEHGDLPNLNAAVGAAGWSKGERRKFVPKSGEVSMLKAATLALWGTNQDSDSGGWAVAL